MRKDTVILVLFYVFFVISGTHLFANEETVLRLGGEAGWGMASQYQGVGEYDSVRPYTVMALSSALELHDPSLDMMLSFDEASPSQFRDKTGNYSVETSDALSFVGGNIARHGGGAARFFAAESIYNKNPLEIIPRNSGTLLSSNQHIKDFSIEFWLYPINAENGEQVLSWFASRQTAEGKSVLQRFQCTIVRNKLQWDFIDFFFSPDDRDGMTLSVSASNPLIPKMWSHHLIRFDSDTGRMEYLVNGELEGIVYAGFSGHEGSDVYLPVSGGGGRLVLGNRYTGLIDEFCAYRSYREQVDVSKFERRGGSFRTIPINMGSTNSWVKRIDVSGGLTSGLSVPLKNTYLGDRILQFSNHEALQFFIRTSDNPYQWANNDEGWVSFIPGTELPDEIRGKWMQIKVDMYPDGDAESSPYIDAIEITYMEDSAPPPPLMIYAAARDGAVDLSWRASSAPDLGGYLVYYGTSSAEYFGESALLGASPIDVGNSTSLRLDGLENGTLYYFAVAAYDKAHEPHIGPFSRETAARPLKTLYTSSLAY